MRDFFVFDSINGLAIVRTGPKPSTTRFQGRITGPLGKPPFDWLRTSSAVLGVRQNTAKPSGFALGPLQPYLFPVNGPARQLPKLANAAGPLDELYWMGESGIAIAAFGTKGFLYKPEHDDPHPTLAFVDALNGKVLQAAAIASIPDLPTKSRVGAISHSMNAKGIITALIAFQSNRWVVWTQGKAPRILQLGTKYVHQFTVTPNGRDVLVMKNLSASGATCELNPNCPPPTPQTGPIAELRSLSTGNIIWSLRGTAREFSGSDVPAISPDGRYALISMPREKHRSTTALISMASGKIIQQIPRPSTSGCTVGFSRDGRKAWISGETTVYIFDIAK
ncbi:WD40 repeat domain-containing protein [Sphingobium cloacae]|uniref:hypothetical protein n=1 Tax=Sphingobium cloacae TaxID=120107 RepID=UPI000F5155E5|nr:hypothetical protein [Sphingobium cloacae]